jgi:hypothetical protein
MLHFRLSHWPTSAKSASSAFVFWLTALLVSIPLLRGSVQAVASQQNEEVMTHQTVIDPVRAQTGDEVIIHSIQQSQANFDPSPRAILQLKKAGVSDAVIQAMMGKEAGKPVTAPDAPVSSGPAGISEGTSPPSTGLPTEIGVYIKKHNEWVEIQPEVMNGKTGGVLKKIGTPGIVKENINGRMNGPHSCNYVETPLEVLICTPEGVAIEEYQSCAGASRKRRASSAP